jgi:hypothetical protein
LKQFFISHYEYLLRIYIKVDKCDWTKFVSFQTKVTWGQCKPTSMLVLGENTRIIVEGRVFS